MRNYCWVTMQGSGKIMFMPFPLNLKEKHQSWNFFFRDLKRFPYYVNSQVSDFTFRFRWTIGACEVLWRGGKSWSSVLQKRGSHIWCKSKQNQKIKISKNSCNMYALCWLLSSYFIYFWFILTSLVCYIVYFLMLLGLLKQDAIFIV